MDLKKASEAFNRQQQGLNNLRRLVTEVEDVARLLSAVGLDKVADQLGWIARDLDLVHRDIVKAVDDKLTAELEAARESEASILTALLEKCKGR